MSGAIGAIERSGVTQIHFSLLVNGEENGFENYIGQCH
jgi:hypothetical protein